MGMFWVLGLAWLGWVSNGPAEVERSLTFKDAREINCQWLYLKDGRSLPIKGGLEIDGQFIRFVDIRGNYLQLPLRLVDLERRSPEQGVDQPPMKPVQRVSLRDLAPFYPKKKAGELLITNRKLRGYFKEGPSRIRWVGQADEPLVGKEVKEKSPVKGKDEDPSAEDLLAAQRELNETYRQQSDDVRHKIKQVTSEIDVVKADLFLALTPDARRPYLNRLKSLQAKLVQHQRALQELKREGRRKGAKLRGE